MVHITDIIDLFETFWLVDKHLPSVKPKALRMGTILLKEDIDAYNTCTLLGLTLPLAERKLLYMRPHCSYRKLAKMYNTSHETMRNRYLSIVVDIVNRINDSGATTIKSYLALTN